MLLGDVGPLEQKGDKGAPPPKRRYFTAVGLLENACR